MASDVSRFDDVRVRCHRADHERVTFHSDAAQWFQRPEIEKARARECPKVDGNVQVGASRERHEVWVVVQQPKGITPSLRTQEGETAGRGSHSRITSWPITRRDLSLVRGGALRVTRLDA